MKALFCVVTSPGLALSLIGLARELQARGHEVACVTNQSMAELCERHGLRRIVPPGSEEADRHSFTLWRWNAPAAMLLQLRHIVHAFKTFEPDVIVASPFGHGPVIASEISGKPLVVVGGLTHIWGRGTWRATDAARWLDECRSAVGLPARGSSSEAPWLGQLFLLQSTPTLSGAPEGTDAVCHVGDCTWDPPGDQDPELAAWLASAPATRRIVFAVCGREFGFAPFDEMLAETAARLDLTVVIDTARSDFTRSYESGRVFAKPGIVRTLVLPRASVVLGTGHPTTVLSALRWELPLVLLPNGSGTDEAAAACVAAGVARAHPAEQLSVDILVDMLSDAITSHTMRFAASRLRLELEAHGGLGGAARRIVELVQRAKQLGDPRMIASTA